MDLEVLSIVLSTLAAPIGAVVGSLLARAKYRAEVKNSELDNVRKANDMLMEGVVEPLSKQIKKIDRELQRLRKAVEKIPLCPHAADCPVSRELQNSAERDEAGGDAGGRG